MENRSRRYAQAVAVACLLVAAFSSGARADGNSFGGTGLYLTHGAETLEPGALRLGGYLSYTKYDLSEDPEDWDLAPQLAWAPVRNLELMAAVPLLRHHVAPGDDTTGVGDGFVGLKYRLFPRLAALGFVTLPFGDEDEDMGSGQPEFGFAGVVSLPLGKGVAADLNLGYRAAGGDVDDSLFYGLGLSVPVGGRTKLFGEVGGRTYGDGHTHDTMQFDVGVRHRLTERVSLTAGGGSGLRGDYGSEDPEVRLFAGLSMLLGRAAEKPAPAPPPPAPAPAVAPPPTAPAPAPVVAPPPAPAPAPPPAAAPRPAALAPAPPPPPPPAPAPQAPAPAAAPAPPPGLEAAKQRLAAAEIFFEYDRARLTPEGERALKQVAADLLQFPGFSFTIEGHADDRGASTYNKVLGLRRAETVMRYLVKAGVAFERMKLASQGELRPKIPKKDAQSRAVNRRVTFSALP